MASRSATPSDPSTTAPATPARAPKKAASKAPAKPKARKRTTSTYDEWAGPISPILVIGEQQAFDLDALTTTPVAPSSPAVEPPEMVQVSFAEYLGEGGMADLVAEEAATRRIAKGKARAGDVEIFVEFALLLDNVAWGLGARNIHQSTQRLVRRIAAKPHLMDRHATDALGYLERLRPCVGAPAIPRWMTARAPR